MEGATDHSVPTKTCCGSSISLPILKPSLKQQRPWFSSWDHVSAQPRRAAFLCVSPSCASFYGRALVGEPNGSPGAYVTGLLTLPCARPPHLAVGRGLITHVRGRIMRQSPHAHSGLDVSQLIQEISRDAIRHAAVAPTYMAALDITGAALLAIAFLVKNGVQHG